MLIPFRWFALLTPLGDVPENILPPSPGDPTPTPRVERERRPDCEFCECRLNTNGEVLRLSDKARKFRDQDERIATVEKELAATKTKLDAANARITELSATPAATRAGVALVG